jgi:hypothetical protein
MDNYFECIKCKYKTDLKVNMRKHLNKIKKCKKTFETIPYSDEEIYDLSLTRVGLRTIKDNETFICEFCNTTYSNSYTLKRHISKFCKEKEEIEKLKNAENLEKTEAEKIITNIENQTNNTTNIQNNINNNVNNNVNNNINIINLPIGFEKDWNTEHMNNYLKELIVVSDNKYTSLLYKILNNKKNLNVIFDKEMDQGLIFTENEYKNIEKQEIVNMSMEKLHKELNRMIDDVLNSDEIFCLKSIESHKDLINNKYSEYTHNEAIQKIVQKYIIGIYDNTKNNANEYLIEYNKMQQEGF